MKTIYLDYNATTPIDPLVVHEMKPFLDQYFGNPSSSHEFGIKTKSAIEKARAQVATLIGCHADEIVFTSGGTESNNYAIKGAALANQHKGNHIITSKIEHPAVIEVCKYLEKRGFKVSYIDVDEFGMVNSKDVEKEISPSTILISIMHANNEVGTIQPIQEISQIAKKNSILFHTDAAQSIGKIDVKVHDLGVNLLSIAGHKLYAPKGIGALYIRRGVLLEKLIHGADHEQNLRAGTENVLEIVGLGKACEIISEKNKSQYNDLKQLGGYFLNEIEKLELDTRLNGHPVKKLPNTFSIGFKNIEANTLLNKMTGIAASAGAACHTDNLEVSGVLTAMRVPTTYAMGTIRFSIGRFTTESEIESAINIISSAVKKTNQSFISSDTTKSKDIKLTQFTKGLGCACKIRPQYLERILSNFKSPLNINSIIGSKNFEDAAIYKINNQTALAQSVDFLTPMVDDAYTFGAIAATNALSDIYAMGAKPVFGLNIAAFPDNLLPEQVLMDILKGAEDKAKEAGIDILGGHTIEDTEPKFGMVVTGILEPEKAWLNSTAQKNDILILTKPIGTGILATATKKGLGPFTECIESMLELNATSMDVAKKYKINACTDISGFGLLGHLLEMMKGCGYTAEIINSRVSFFENTLELVREGFVSGGTKNNLDYVSGYVDFDQDVPAIIKLALADAQTSGGLLFSVAQEQAETLNSELLENGVKSQKIGVVRAKQHYSIIVK